jgi:hypothetical protein
MDFAVRCPLVRYGRLLFGFCPSARTFVLCFLRTSPHGESMRKKRNPPQGAAVVINNSVKAPADVMFSSALIYASVPEHPEGHDMVVKTLRIFALR